MEIANDTASNDTTGPIQYGDWMGIDFIEIVASTASFYHSDPAPTVSRTLAGVVLHKELNATG